MTSLVLLRNFFHRFRRLVFDFSIWRLIQGERPCLGTDKTCIKYLLGSGAASEKSSIHFYVTGGAKLCNVFIHHREEGWCEREVKRNWDQTEIEDKCCFRRAGLSINTSRHTCSPLKCAV